MQKSYGHNYDLNFIQQYLFKGDHSISRPDMD